MAKIIKLITQDGQNVEFVDEIIGSGGMKDAYFSPDKSYVVLFYRNNPDFQAKDRLLMLTGRYKESVFNQVGGDYWKNLFCWPTSVVTYNGKLGIVTPTYQKHFFFEPILVLF